LPIIDKRQIEFDAKVMIRAIALSSQTLGSIGLPALRPIELRFCPEEGMVEVLYDPNENHEAIRLKGASLGAFLVSYCIRAGIPMPRFADKEFRVLAHSVTVSFKTVYAEAPAHEASSGFHRYSRVRG
jgi:hypothetical protein